MNTVYSVESDREREAWWDNLRKREEYGRNQDLTKTFLVEKFDIAGYGTVYSLAKRIYVAPSEGELTVTARTREEAMDIVAGMTAAEKTR